MAKALQDLKHSSPTAGEWDRLFETLVAYLNHVSQVQRIHLKPLAVYAEKQVQEFANHMNDLADVLFAVFSELKAFGEYEIKSWQIVKSTTGSHLCECSICKPKG